jgi:predicted small metal-binding protein
MDDQLTVRCACGWETTGSEEAVVTATREHGERVHNMSATREQILAMAVRPARVETGDVPTSGT